MEWYYLRDGKTMGPVPEGSIRAWLESGFLQPDDLLWRAGLAQWLPVVELAEFGGSGGTEPPAGPDEGGTHQTSIDSDATADRGTSGTVARGADVTGGPARDGRAGDTQPDGPLAGGPGDPGAGPAPRGGPRQAYPSTGAAGDAHQPFGGPGSLHGAAEHSRPAASAWSHAPADWAEAPAVYANVWARAGAAAIDLMLLVSAVLVVFRPELPTTGNIEEMAKLNPAITPVFMAVAWLYFGLMEGSALQASLGKLAFGLKVTDLEGNRLPAGRALVRGLLKVVLMEITAFLSFLPAAFTSRRQALHDMVAGSTVLIR